MNEKVTAQQLARTLINEGIPFTKVYDEDALVDPGVDLWSRGVREYSVLIDQRFGDLNFVKFNSKSRQLFVIETTHDIPQLIGAIRKEMK